MALQASWQQYTLREEALAQELQRTQEAMRAMQQQRDRMSQQLKEAEALMLQQGQLAKQAYQAAYKDVQAELQTELTDAHRAVERATASQRSLRAQLRNREERCAALQRECDAARGAREHWVG